MAQLKSMLHKHGDLSSAPQNSQKSQGKWLVPAIGERREVKAGEPVGLASQPIKLNL